MNDNNDLDKIINDFIAYKNKIGELPTKKIQQSYRSAIKLFCELLKIKEFEHINISSEMLEDSRYELLGKYDISENTVKSYKSRFIRFCKWLNKKEQYEIKNELDKENVMKNNTQQEAKVKKINFNLELMKYAKLSALALKKEILGGKVTLTDLINEAIDNYLEKHKTELNDIKGLY